MGKKRRKIFFVSQESVAYSREFEVGLLVNVLVVFSHYSDESFCHQVYAHALGWLSRQGHVVKSRHLYKIQFNPVLSHEDLEALHTGKSLSDDILREQAYIAWADCLVFVYPIWWWERPAVLKGWFDRVFTSGFAFDYSKEGGTVGKLKGKKALIIQSIGMPCTYPQMLEKGHLFKRSIVEGTLNFSGIEPCHVLTLSGFLGVKLNKFSDHFRDVETFLFSSLR